MTSNTIDLRSLHQAVDRLGPEQLEQLQAFLSHLEPSGVLSIYRIQEHAVDAGVDDLAENHDHYLYGVPVDSVKHG